MNSHACILTCSKSDVQGGVFAGNGTDAAMEQAMAASLRDIQNHEERVRKQAQQAQQAQRETLGANGDPVQPHGGTLAYVPALPPCFESFLSMACL